MHVDACDSLYEGYFALPASFLTDVSGNCEIATGSDWFPEVFDRGVFVDKSLLVRDVLKGFQAKLFCRPRRFGKTLAVTMLKDFFECVPCADPAAHGRFERLAIWQADEGAWHVHQGRYPVIMLSLKEAAAATWEQTLAGFSDLMARECGRHRCLLESDRIASGDRAWFERVQAHEATVADLASFLRTLSSMLETYHGEKCMIFVDEYDAPITAAHEHGFYTEAVSFMRNWLSGGLKTNPSLARGVLAGVQRISKESIFSGLNNVQVNTALSQVSEERFGFTLPEVEALVSYSGHADRLGELQAWYDGYRFGSADIFNPWSVLTYLASGCVAQPYWVNTSGNAVLGRALRGGDVATTDTVLSLLGEGAAVSQRVDPNIAYDEIGVRPSAIWSVLYMAGYLTTDDTDFPEDPARVRRLRVPNAEVRSVFRREVVERAQDGAGEGQLV